MQHAAPRLRRIRPIGCGAVRAGHDTRGCTGECKINYRLFRGRRADVVGVTGRAEGDCNIIGVEGVLLGIEAGV
jgi:hypothetical protein